MTEKYVDSSGELATNEPYELAELYDVIGSMISSRPLLAEDIFELEAIANTMLKNYKHEEGELMVFVESDSSLYYRDDAQAYWQFTDNPLRLRYLKIDAFVVDESDAPSGARLFVDLSTASALDAYEEYTIVLACEGDGRIRRLLHDVHEPWSTDDSVPDSSDWMQHFLLSRYDPNRQTRQLKWSDKDRFRVWNTCEEHVTTFLSGDGISAKDMIEEMQDLVASGRVADMDEFLTAFNLYLNEYSVVSRNIAALVDGVVECLKPAHAASVQVQLQKDYLDERQVCPLAIDRIVADDGSETWVLLAYHDKQLIRCRMDDNENIFFFLINDDQGDQEDR